MKKTLFICAFALVLSLLIPFSSGLALATATDETDANTFTLQTNIFAEFYNGGSYTRNSTIHLNTEEGAPDYSSAFHGNPKHLIKTTYFNGLTLFMTDDGEGNINSGYTSKTSGTDVDLYHFVRDKNNNMDNIVSYGKLGDIDSFFVTMKDFNDYSTNGLLSKWITTDNGTTYETTDTQILNDMMAFVASCYTNGENNDYLTLSKGVISIKGPYLSMKLYVDTQTAENKLDNNDGLLASALVVAGTSGLDLNVVSNF